MTKPKTIIATTAAFLLSVTSSFAIDVGVGGVGVSAGEGGVSGSASVGDASVGAGASTDGSVGAGASAGGASVGASASSDGSASAGASAGGASVSGGVGSDGSVGGSASVGGTSAGGGASVGGGGSTGGGASGTSGTSSGPSGGGSGPSSSSSASSSSGAGGSPGSSGTSNDSGGGGSSAQSGTSSSSGGEGGAPAGPLVQTRTAGIPAVRTPEVLPDRIMLPPNLRPDGGGGILSRQEVASTPMRTIAGTSRQVIDACAQTVAQAAKPYGLVEVAAVSYGPARQLSDGGYRAPVFTRVTYRRQGGYEVRQAPIWCHIDGSGAVSSLSDIT